MAAKNIAGLPSERTDGFSYYRDRDIHMDTAKGLPVSGFDIHMNTAKGLTFSNDINMQTAKGTSTIKQPGLQLWERELLDTAEVKRKATVAQLCTCFVDSVRR